MKSLTNLTIRCQRRLIRTIGTIITATTLLTSQSLWLLTKSALADKTDGSSAICAVPGKDGSPTISGGQVNTYFAGTSGLASAGSLNITVGAGSGFTSDIQSGDLLMIIQMQGADIDSTNTNAYGDGNPTNPIPNPTANYPAGGIVSGNLDNANFTSGNFEYAVATNNVPISGGTITLSSPLVNSYSNADATTTQGQRRFQVIRVPQYANLTLSGTITAAPWNGTTGGIVALDVAGKMTFAGGQINVDGLGFRGGGGRRLEGDNTLSNTDVVSPSTKNGHASKGEGTAGTPRYLINQSNSALIDTGVEGYPDGSYGRGAPGTAGGGGTDGYPRTTGNNDNKEFGNGHNAGGGGGSNGGIGGKGGRTWHSALPYGGDGGAAFSVASARRLVLGGGGGAGTNNDGTGTPGNGLTSSGAPGGGMVFLRTGSIAGSGIINANGATPPLIPDNDASGGGGAGGSVLVISQNSTTAGLSINANGGRGGTNTGGGSPHGPGGGGGGGTVFATPGAITTLAGGQPGTTNNQATNFGGATAGDGLSGPINTSPADATTSISGASCLIQANKTTSTPTSVAPGTATYTITATNPGGLKGAGTEQVVISDDLLPSGFTHTTVPITPVYTGGASGPTSVTSTGTTTRPSWSGFKIPPGGSVSITFTVNIANGTAPGKYDNSATATGKYYNESANVNTAPVTAAVVDSNYNGTLAANTGEDVTITLSSTLTTDKSVALVVDSDKSGGTVPLSSQVPTPGDILEYTVVVTNTSTTVQRDNVVLTDTIPANTTYVPGSLQVSAGANTGAKTDTSGDDQANIAGSQVVFRLGTGADGTVGGTLGTTAANNTSTIKFRVKVNDPLPNGVTTVSNQAVVSSNGVGNVNSNDPTTPTPLDPTVTKIAPRLRLVKRVTGVKKFGSSTVTAITAYNDSSTDVNDDNTVIGWASGANTYLLGAITGNQIPASLGAPGFNDEVEYTIYYLGDGGIPAQNVNICDFVPANQTYVPGTMQLDRGGTISSIVDTPVSAGASGFYTASFPAACTGTNNGQGAAYFQVGNINSSYGFIRFRAKVN
ncbi:hypothetical protein NIES4071_99790 [Calothrix sp. NIES-4071]|nr:hypothetical protein NIES4071_99790 [Calothrix sp. NIES-4071]BAZ64241.1 hypothetical protein NIES4105_99720 [Calothrix sp. NIES-4105]